MATQVQRRRGTTTEHSTFTGAEGELTVDTTKDTVVVHDGATAGGRPLAREDLNNVSSADVTAKVSAGTTSAAGIVQLTDSTSSTSTTTAATPNSVKLAKDAADAAQATANAALPATGGTISSDLTISGDLTVDGTTTTINSETLLVKDKNIEMGVVDTPTDSTADGGGITLKGATDKTINWIDTTDAWTSSERFDFPAGTAATPSIILNGDVNSGIYQPGADQVAISTGGSGRLFIDSTGRVLIGNTAALNLGGTAGLEGLQIAGIGLSSSRWTDSASGPFLTLAKSRSTTVGSNSIVSINDRLGAVSFNGDNGVSFSAAALIEGRVDGTPAGPTPGPVSMPGRIMLSTTPVGSTTPTERLRITSTGQLSHIGGGSTVSPAVGFNGSAPANSLVVDSLGKVGIGTSTVDSLLHLSKSDATAYSATATDGQVGIGPTIYLENPANLNTPVGGQIVFGMRSTEEQARIGATGGTAPVLTFGTGDAERMRITSTGVGIANTNPGAELDVNGKVIIQSALGVGGANFGTAGQVLVSNGSSAAPSWGAPYLAKNIALLPALP